MPISRPVLGRGVQPSAPASRGVPLPRLWRWALGARTRGKTSNEIWPPMEKVRSRCANRSRSVATIFWLRACERGAAEVGGWGYRQQAIVLPAKGRRGAARGQGEEAAAARGLRPRAPQRSSTAVEAVGPALQPASAAALLRVALLRPPLTCPPRQAASSLQSWHAAGTPRRAPDAVLQVVLLKGVALRLAAVAPDRAHVQHACGGGGGGGGKGIGTGCGAAPWRRRSTARRLAHARPRMAAPMLRESPQGRQRQLAPTLPTHRCGTR